MVVSACRIGPRKRFFSEMKGGRFRLSRPLSGKAGSRSDHGAPAGLRAESRPDIRLVGTVTGRRFETLDRWLESTGIAESKIAFPDRSTLLPAQVRCRRNQADVGTATCGGTGPAPPGGLPFASAFPRLEKNPQKRGIRILVWEPVLAPSSLFAPACRFLISADFLVTSLSCGFGCCS